MTDSCHHGHGWRGCSAAGTSTRGRRGPPTPCVFHRAYEFKQPLGSRQTESVTAFGNRSHGALPGTFQEAASFNQPREGNVTSMMMSMIFHEAVAFKPLNSWQTGSVTSLAFVFAIAEVFNQPLNRGRRNRPRP